MSLQAWEGEEIYDLTGSEDDLVEDLLAEGSRDPRLLERLEREGGPIQPGITLAALIERRRRSESWWFTYLLWHPGTWLELDGSVCAKRAPEHWIVAECLN